MTFVDANVFVRLAVAADDATQLKQSQKLFSGAENVAAFNKKHFVKLGVDLYPI